MPWRRKWQPTPAFLPGEFHWQRSLVGYRPWGCKELDMTEQLTVSLSFPHYGASELRRLETVAATRMVSLTGNSPPWLIMPFEYLELGSVTWSANLAQTLNLTLLRAIQINWNINILKNRSSNNSKALVTVQAFSYTILENLTMFAIFIIVLALFFRNGMIAKHWHIWFDDSFPKPIALISVKEFCPGKLWIHHKKKEDNFSIGLVVARCFCFFYFFIICYGE